MDSLALDINRVLREMMKVTGKSPSQLAALIDKPGSTVNRYIKADGTPKESESVMSAVTLALLCGRTGVSVIFSGGNIFIAPKGDREFAKDGDEVRLLRGWRRLEPQERKMFRKMLKGLLPPGEADDILPAA